jgi:Rrf2 family transcriptional regulator, iron-sulfur cluster assembly transcription factor
LGSLEPDRFADAATIAARAKAPPNYLAKLLRLLSRKGILDARKGANGGFRLARPPSDITLYDILDPIEDLVVESDCLLGEGPCRESGSCALHPAWSELRAGMLSFMHSTRLATIVRSPSPTAHT